MKKQRERKPSHKIEKIIAIPDERESNRCLQNVSRIAYNFFNSGTELLSLDYLDEVTDRSRELWTYTSQAILGLDKLGLKVKFFLKDKLEELDPEKLPENHKKYTDTKRVNTSVQELKSKPDLYEENSNITSEDLKDFIANGHIPIVLVDIYTLNGRGKDITFGHFVMIVGYTENEFLIHYLEPGNTIPYRPIEKEVLESARNKLGSDADTIVVFGNKEI